MTSFIGNSFIGKNLQKTTNAMILILAVVTLNITK